MQQDCLILLEGWVVVLAPRVGPKLSMPHETFTAPFNRPLSWTSVGSRTSAISTLPDRIFSAASVRDNLGTTAFASAGKSLTFLAVLFLRVVRDTLAVGRDLAFSENLARNAMAWEALTGANGCALTEYRAVH